MVDHSTKRITIQLIEEIRQALKSIDGYGSIEIIVQDASSVDIVNEARYTIVFLKDDQRDEGPFSSIRENNLKRARKLVADSVSVALAYPEYDFEIIPEKVPPGSGTDYWHKLLTGVFREITVQNIRCSG